MGLLPPVIAELKLNASEFRAGLQEAGAQMDEAAEKGQTTGQKLKAGFGVGALAVGAAASGIGLALTNLGSKEQAASQQLSTAFSNAGFSVKTYGKQIDDAVKKNENYGVSSADTKNALTALMNATHDPIQAMNDLSVAVDVAAAQHESLTAAAKQVAQAAQGTGKLIKAYGIDLTGVKTAADKGKIAMLDLSNATKGQAAAAADTFKGKIDAMKTKLEDFIAGPASKIGPVLTAMGPALMGIGTIIESGVLPPVAMAIVQFGLMLAPILAVAAAAYVIYRNWGTISAFFEQLWGDVTRIFMKAWDSIKKAFQDAWNAITGVFDSAVNMIKSHLTLILTIFAPWLEAIIQIKDHWTQIWNDLKAGFQVVVGLIVGIAKDLISTALAPINFAVGLVQGVWSAAWGAVTGIVQGAWKILSGIFDQIISKVHDVTNAVGDVVGLPGKVGKGIGHAIAGVFDKGGYVPGQPGAPMLAVVHGGEYVNTRAQVAGALSSGGGGGFHIHEGAVQLVVQGGLDETVLPAVQDLVHREFRRLAGAVRNR